MIVNLWVDRSTHAFGISFLEDRVCWSYGRQKRIWSCRVFFGMALKMLERGDMMECI